MRKPHRRSLKSVSTQCTAEAATRFRRAGLVSDSNP